MMLQPSYFYHTFVIQNIDSLEILRLSQTDFEADLEESNTWLYLSWPFTNYYRSELLLSLDL